jgi:hypothetical protein
MTPEQFISGYEHRISSFALKLRIFLFSRLPGVHEEVDLSAKIISYHYGPGYKNVICVIIFSKKRIKLGFYKGCELDDPEQLLTGTGRVHRFVEIKSEEGIYAPALKTLLSEALNNHKIRTT